MAIEVSTTLEEAEEGRARGRVRDLGAAATLDQIAELNRWDGVSGVLGTRQYARNSPDQELRVLDQNFSAGSIHDHPNVRWTSGLAELAFVVNGQYLRVRHTDYQHNQVSSVPAGGRADYLSRDLVEPPEIPAAVLALPTGLNTDGTLDLVNDTQAKWMSEIPANPDRYRADLVFLEVWLEEVDGAGAGTDAAESDRHADIASTALEVYELNTRLSATGMKDRLENLANRPFGTQVVDDGTGQPESKHYVVAYRFNTVPIGNCAPITGVPPLPIVQIAATNPNQHAHELDAPLTQQQFDDLRNGVVAFIELTSSDSSAAPDTPAHNHTYRITWDAGRGVLEGIDVTPVPVGHQHGVIITQGFPGSVPFDEEKARQGIIDSTNRFRLVRDLDMMDLFDGSTQDLVGGRYGRFEYADVEQAMELCFGLEGNGASLTESYDFGFRGIFYLNDPDDPTAAFPGSLNSAKYNRRSVLIGELDAAGRQTIDRGFNDSQLYVATTTHPEVLNGVSWAIPFEVLVRSPLENWNPAGVTELDSFGAHVQAGTQADPWPSIYNNNIYKTPAAIWSGGLTNADPADTATGTIWVTGADGNAYEMTASGMWVRDLNGVRTRWPCFKNARDGSMEGVGQHILRRKVFDLFAKVVEGTLTKDDIRSLGDFEGVGPFVDALTPGSSTAAPTTGTFTDPTATLLSFNVNHGLGLTDQLPSVTYFSDENGKVLPDEVYVDADNLTATFTPPLSATETINWRAT